MRIDERADRLQFVDALRPLARSYPKNAPPISIAHPELGTFGRIEGHAIHREPRRISEREWKALCRDEARYLRRKRWLDAEVYHALQCTSFDNIIAQRRNGQGNDQWQTKRNYTTVANVWSCPIEVAGTLGSTTLAALPGAVLNGATAGAIPLRVTGVGFKKFLINAGVQHPTGTNVVLFSDVLAGGDGISATLTTAQTVNSPALTRYTGTEAAGNMLTFLVTTALGATASNITGTYVNQAGTSESFPSTAMTVSSILHRLNPIAGGPMVQLASGASGVRSLTNVTLSASMAAGALAYLIYRPLTAVPSIATNTFAERSTPSALGGMVELVKGSDSQHGYLCPMILSSTTGVGNQIYNYTIVDEN